jgi:hypothetical protein
MPEVEVRFTDGEKEDEIVRLDDAKEIKRHKLDEAIIYVKPSGQECRYRDGVLVNCDPVPKKPKAEKVTAPKVTKSTAKVKTPKVETVNTVSKDAAVAEDKKKIAAAHEKAAVKTKRTSNHNTNGAVELVAKKLGDKFFLFAKNEVEISIRTAKSSQYDTLAEAEEAATKLNAKYGFIEAPASSEELAQAGFIPTNDLEALANHAKDGGTITTNDYYAALQATEAM